MTTKIIFLDDRQKKITKNVLTSTETIINLCEIASKGHEPFGSCVYI
jgi:hypothetical protein